MGSGSSFGGTSRSLESVSYLVSDNAETRSKAYADYRSGTAKAREDIIHGRFEKKNTERDTSELRDSSLARNSITSPSKTAKRAYVVLVDNSGSNRAIADHFLKSSGHFTAFAQSIDAMAEVAFIYFSDHCDGELLFQFADFSPPTEAGDKQLYNSFLRIRGASGDDEAEAIECALLRASEIDFGDIPVQDRTVILVTDVVGHRMGLTSDDGCPHQVSWRTSMEAIRRTYGKFILIGSGSNPRMVPLQKQFFETAPGVSDSVEVARNFIDLSEIREASHRNGIVANAVLFCMARNAGKQSIQVFLAALYSKWLSNPVFGTRTDEMARIRIRAFAELYLPGVMEPGEIQEMLSDILG